MTVLLLPRRRTPAEIAESRPASDQAVFMCWFDVGRRDAARRADLEMVWRALRVSEEPDVALAGWLEGLAAHRAQVAVERRARAVMA